MVGTRQYASTMAFLEHVAYSGFNSGTQGYLSYAMAGSSLAVADCMQSRNAEDIISRAKELQSNNERPGWLAQTSV
jgi:hypothetical protein